MTVYRVLLYTHLLGAVALFVGGGLEWTASALFRGAASAAEARSWLRVFRVSPPLSGAGLMVLLLSGGYLASLSGAMKQGWVPATLLAVGVALGAGFAVIQPRMGRIRASLPAGNEAPSPELRRRLCDPLLHTAIRARVLLAAGILYLMVAKIPFGRSLAVLALALVAGLAASLPVWRRPS